MGDVLTGVVGSFLAQGAPPDEAAALGLYYSGRAAALAGRGAGLIPDDVVDGLSHVLLEEGDGLTDLDLPFVVFDADPPR
jgi:NAD(P)H-hydrate epimerase